MKNVLSQITKTVLLYIAAFILAYPYNLIICSVTSGGNVWLILICLFMAITGILIWFVLNYKYAIPLKKNSTIKLNKQFYKNLCIQFLIVCIFFILASIKEYNQFYYLPVELYDFWNAIWKNEERATFFSYRTFPMINAGYILIVSINWGFYNLTQLIFDKRIHFDK